MCIKELCLKFHSSGDSSTWPQDTAYFVQEVYPVVRLFLYSASGCRWFSLLLTNLLLFKIFQVFHLVSPKIVDSIRLVKIAQVIFYISSPPLADVEIYLPTFLLPSHNTLPIR